MKEHQRGFSTIEFLIGAVLMTFVIFFPIAAQMEMHTIHKMDQELDRTLQMAAVKGGVTAQIAMDTLQKLKENGIDAKFTPDTNFYNENPIPRGQEITVGIQAERPTKSLYASVMSLAGGDDLDTDHFVVKGTIMSEAVQ